MLYIISFPTRKPGYVRYKVGYASDVQKRFQQYEPESYLIGTKPGDVIDEQILHRRLRQVPGIKVIRSEWYLVPIGGVDIVKIFHEPRKHTEKLVYDSIRLPADVQPDIWERLIQNKSEIEISKVDKNRLLNIYLGLSVNSSFSDEIKLLFANLSKEGQLVNRLKSLCEFLLSNQSYEYILDYIPDSDKIKLFYTSVGPKTCRSLGYAPSRIMNLIDIRDYDKDVLRSEIYSIYSIGQRISFSKLKSDLSDIYSRLKYKKAPKAVDIKDYFEVKLCKFPDPESMGKRTNGYELLRRLNP